MHLFGLYSTSENEKKQPSFKQQQSRETQRNSCETDSLLRGNQVRGIRTVTSSSNSFLLTHSFNRQIVTASVTKGNSGKRTGIRIT